MAVHVVSIGFWLMMMLSIETSLSVNIRSKSSLQCLYCKLNKRWGWYQQGRSAHSLWLTLFSFLSRVFFQGSPCSARAQSTPALEQEVPAMSRCRPRPADRVELVRASGGRPSRRLLPILTDGSRQARVALASPPGFRPRPGSQWTGFHSTVTHRLCKVCLV